MSPERPISPVVNQITPPGVSQITPNVVNQITPPVVTKPYMPKKINKFILNAAIDHLNKNPGLKMNRDSITSKIFNQAIP